MDVVFEFLCLWNSRKSSPGMAKAVGRLDYVLQHDLCLHRAELGSIVRLCVSQHWILIIEILWFSKNSQSSYLSKGSCFLSS